MPDSITYLRLNSDFDKKVDSLPSSLTYLSMFNADDFNQTIDNLPNSLTHLKLGHGFNQSITNLPFSLKTLLITEEYYKLKNNIKLPYGCVLKIV